MANITAEESKDNKHENEHTTTEHTTTTDTTKVVTAIATECFVSTQIKTSISRFDVLLLDQHTQLPCIVPMFVMILWSVLLYRVMIAMKKITSSIGRRVFCDSSHTDQQFLRHECRTSAGTCIQCSPATMNYDSYPKCLTGIDICTDYPTTAEQPISCQDPVSKQLKSNEYQSMDALSNQDSNPTLGQSVMVFVDSKEGFKLGTVKQVKQDNTSYNFQYTLKSGETGWLHSHDLIDDRANSNNFIDTCSWDYQRYCDVVSTTKINDSHHEPSTGVATCIDCPLTEQQLSRQECHAAIDTCIQCPPATTRINDLYQEIPAGVVAGIDWILVSAGWLTVVREKLAVEQQFKVNQHVYAKGTKKLELQQKLLHKWFEKLNNPCIAWKGTMNWPGIKHDFKLRLVDYMLFRYSKVQEKEKTKSQLSLFSEKQPVGKEKQQDNVRQNSVKEISPNIVSTCSKQPAKKKTKLDPSNNTNITKKTKRSNNNSDGDKPNNSDNQNNNNHNDDDEGGAPPRKRSRRASRRNQIAIGNLVTFTMHGQERCGLVTEVLESTQIMVQVQCLPRQVDQTAVQLEETSENDRDALKWYCECLQPIEIATLIKMTDSIVKNELELRNCVKSAVSVKSRAGLLTDIYKSEQSVRDAQSVLGTAQKNLADLETFGKSDDAAYFDTHTILQTNVLNHRTGLNAIVLQLHQYYVTNQCTVFNDFEPQNQQTYNPLDLPTGVRFYRRKILPIYEYRLLTRSEKVDRVCI
jgi:hypothetical protein